MKKKYQKPLSFKKKIIFLFCLINILFLSITTSVFLKTFNNIKEPTIILTKKTLWTTATQMKEKANLRKQKINAWFEDLYSKTTIKKTDTRGSIISILWRNSDELWSFGYLQKINKTIHTKDWIFPTKYQNYWKKLTSNDKTFFERVWLEQISFLSHFSNLGEEYSKYWSYVWSNEDIKKVWKIAENDDYDGFINFLFEKTKLFVEKYEYLIDYFVKKRHMLKNLIPKKKQDKKIYLNKFAYHVKPLVEIKNWKEIQNDKSKIRDLKKERRNTILELSTLVFVKKYQSFFEFDIKTHQNKKEKNSFNVLDQIIVVIYSMFLIIFLFLLINSYYQNKSKKGLE